MCCFNGACTLKPSKYLIQACNQVNDVNIDNSWKHLQRFHVYDRHHVGLINCPHPLKQYGVTEQ